MRSARFWVCVLLFTGCTVNYIDRVALSVAARPIATEFHISPVGMGYLFSAFLWTYLVFLIPWGIVVDRLGTRPVVGFGMAFWSLATLATGPAVWVLRGRLDIILLVSCHHNGCQRTIASTYPTVRNF